MFYAQLILAKKGVLGKVWLAAHWDKKLNRQTIFQTDVTKSAESIANPKTSMPLRVSGSLLLGVVRIYSHKVGYLSSDCDEALTKMKMAFRPGTDPFATTGRTAGGKEQTSATTAKEKEELPDEHADDGGSRDGANGRPRRKSAQEAVALARRQRREVEKEEAPSVGRSLDIDAIFPLDEGFYSSAAASQTMARRQDITLEESEAAVVGRRSLYGAGGSVGAAGLVQVKDEEEPTQPMLGEGAGGSQQQSQLELEEGAEGKEKEEAEVWEAFDPSKLDWLGNGGEGGGGGGGQDYYGGDDDFNMDDDGDLGPYEEEEPEAGRFSRGTGADGEGDGSLVLEGDGRRELSLLGSSTNNKSDGSVVLSAGGGAEEQEEGMQVDDDGGRPSGIGGGGRTPPNGGGLRDLSLLSSGGGAGGSGLLRQSLASEESGGALSARIRIGLGNNRRGSAASSSSAAAAVSSASKRRLSSGRKRRLPVDRSLHITGKQMRERIADFADLVEPRVRPRERAAALLSGGQGRWQRKDGEEEGEDDDWGLDAAAGGGGGGGGMASRVEALAPLEERMARHSLSGSLAPELEQVVGLMMRQGRAFRLPVARASAAGVAAAAGLLTPGKGGGGGSPGVDGEEGGGSPFGRGRKRGREVEGQGDGEQGDGAGAGGFGGGGEEGEEQDEFGFFGGGGDDDDFRMDDDDFGGGENGHIFGGEDDDDDDSEAAEEARRRGLDSEEEDEDDDDGFIRTNAAGADDDPEAVGQAARWHPNTVRMCKLLRARMRKRGDGSLAFAADMARGARRTKAANMFWEVLQLKTWGFIEVAQEGPGAFPEIEIRPGERFEEPIPA